MQTQAGSQYTRRDVFDLNGHLSPLVQALQVILARMGILEPNSTIRISLYSL